MFDLDYALNVLTMQSKETVTPHIGQDPWNYGICCMSVLTYRGKNASMLFRGLHRHMALASTQVSASCGRLGSIYFPKRMPQFVTNRLQTSRQNRTEMTNEQDSSERQSVSF